MPPQWLPFEQEIAEMEALLARLEADAGARVGSSEEVRRIRRELVNLKRKKYSNLTAWETIQVSRHQDRPQTFDYIDLILDEFVELHGDRAIGDDRAILIPNCMTRLTDIQDGASNTILLTEDAGRPRL
jgi:acetyl-CoA carboxylase carboxyl transferase subunit alpha